MNIIYEKIASYCKTNNMSVRQFEIDCDISNGTIGGLKKSEHNKLSMDTVEKISKKYSDLALHIFSKPFMAVSDNTVHSTIPVADPNDMNAVLEENRLLKDELLELMREYRKLMKESK